MSTFFRICIVFQLIFINGASGTTFCGEITERIGAKGFSHKFEVQLVEYHGRLLDASSKLGLNYTEFLDRLVRFKESPKSFFQQVDNFKQGIKVPFWKNIFSPAELVKNIKGRRITNPNFLNSFFMMAGIHISAQAFAHISAFGFKKLDIMSAQLTALLITEIALTASSAKHAAYLVANPNLKESMEKMYSKLQKKEQTYLARFTNSMRNIGFHLKKISHRTGGKVVGLAKVAFLSSLIPFSILASSGTSSFSEALAMTIVSSGFHTAFISVWSNFRYEVFYGSLLPSINRSIGLRSIYLERALVLGLISFNMAVASYSYTYGNNAFYKLFSLELR